MSSQCSLKNYKFRREVKNSKIEEIWGPTSFELKTLETQILYQKIFSGDSNSGHNEENS